MHITHMHDLAMLEGSMTLVETEPPVPGREGL